jgi:uncharacterized protein YraI
MSFHKAFFLASTILVASIAVPAAAQAADAVATRSGTLRAGPASDFPSVGHISNGDDLQVYGCTDGYSWCDVSDGDNRGWFPGSRIAYVRDGDQEILPDVGADIGIGIIGFGVADYWGAHYHNRPFFRQEQRFQGRYHGPQPVPNRGPQPFHPGANQQRTQQPQSRVNQPHVNPPANQQPHVNQQPHNPQPNHVTPQVQHQVRPQFQHVNPPVHANAPHPPAVNNAPRQAPRGPASPAPCPEGKCH